MVPFRCSGDLVANHVSLSCDELNAICGDASPRQNSSCAGVITVGGVLFSRDIRASLKVLNLRNLNFFKSLQG